MFRVESQREWEDLVLRGLKEELWALEVAAEMSLDVIEEPEKLKMKLEISFPT